MQDQALNGEFIAIESPYRGGEKGCAEYLRKTMRSLFESGHIPLASHITYTSVLDDQAPVERHLGIEAGFSLYRALGSRCRRLFAIQRGWSRGMIDGLEDERGRQRYTNAQRPWVKGWPPSTQKQVIWPSHMPFIVAQDYATKELITIAWSKDRVYLRYEDSGDQYYMEVK